MNALISLLVTAVLKMYLDFMQTETIQLEIRLRVGHDFVDFLKKVLPVLEQMPTTMQKLFVAVEQVAVQIENDLNNMEEVSDNLSSSSSPSSLSVASSFSSASSQSSGSSQSSSSSGSSASSGSSQSSGSSESSSESVSSGSSQSAIIPVPPPLSARIGIGINSTSLRTQFASGRVLSPASNSEFINALDLAKANPTEPFHIYLPPGSVIDYPRNYLAGMKRPPNIPVVIKGESTIGQPPATLRYLFQDKPVEGVAFVNLAIEGESRFLGADIKHVLFEDILSWLDLQGERIYKVGPGPSKIENVSVRFTRMLDHWAYPSTTLMHGLFGYNRKDFLMEYCVLDHNGWDPSGDRSTPYDQGGPSSREHNAYLAAPGENDIVRYCIFARGSSHGIHFRCGGEIYGNLFILNPIGLQFGYGDDSSFSKYGKVRGKCHDNVFVGADDIGGGIGSPAGIGIWLTATDNVEFDRNSFILNGTSDTNNACFRIEAQYPTSAIITNNRSYRWGPMIYTDPSGPASNVSLVQSNNRESLTYIELDLAMYVKSQVFLDQIRSGGIDPKQLSEYSSRLSNAFDS